MNQTDLTPTACSGEQPASTPVHLDPASIKQLLNDIRETVETSFAAALARIPALSETPKSTGLDLKDAEKLKAADLRFALLTGKLPENSGILIDTKTLAKLLSISKAHLYRLQAEEALLAPIQVGHVKRWRLTEIIEWIGSGVPSTNHVECDESKQIQAKRKVKVRPIEYVNIIRPSVDCLEQGKSLMVDVRGLAAFLGIPPTKLPQLLCTDRLPLPRRLGLGKCRRWSVLELLEWVEAGCPRRTE